MISNYYENHERKKMPQIQVAGQVNMIRWEGKRVSIWENVSLPNGQEGSRLWTCWFSGPTPLQEQDFAEIKGELSTKIGNYTNKAGEEKTVVEHHIQNAELVQVVTAEKQAANAASFDEVPF